MINMVPHLCVLCFSRVGVLYFLEFDSVLGDKNIKQLLKIVMPTHIRWLTHGGANAAIIHDLEVLLQFFTGPEKDRDPKAMGIGKLMNKFDFIAALYLLADMFPIMDMYVQHNLNDEHECGGIHSDTYVCHLNGPLVRTAVALQAKEFDFSRAISQTTQGIDLLRRLKDDPMSGAYSSNFVVIYESIFERYQPQWPRRPRADVPAFKWVNGGERKTTEPDRQEELDAAAKFGISASALPDKRPTRTLYSKGASANEAWDVEQAVLTVSRFQRAEKAAAKHGVPISGTSVAAPVAAAAPVAPVVVSEPVRSRLAAAASEAQPRTKQTTLSFSSSATANSTTATTATTGSTTSTSSHTVVDADELQTYWLLVAALESGLSISSTATEAMEALMLEQVSRR